MAAAETRAERLKSIWSAAIEAVGGRQSVINALRSDSPFTPDLIIAVGKAASGMCVGALEQFPGCAALVVTKYGHAETELQQQAAVEIIESAHPIPDENSLAAGAALLDRMRALPDDSRVLLLVSGGASALAEALPQGMTLDDLQAITDEMIAGGKTIAQINARRKQTSLIKDGKLIEAFGGEEIRVYAISDVEGDGIETIGSGLGDCRRARARASSKIIASNGLARQQAAQRAAELGLTVQFNQETLYGDVFELARTIGDKLQTAAAGV